MAIIGCGSIAKSRHIPEYMANSNTEIVAFCDVQLERAEKLTSIYKGKAYSSYKEMLHNEKPDIVSICTPLGTHAEIAIDCANKGVHVLCEKPIATSESEALAMIEAAERNDIQLMIAHNQRFLPWHIKAKQIIREGRLGRPLSFRTSFSHSGPENWSVDGIDSWFFDKTQALAGVIVDLGIHKVDIICWLLEDEVVEVGAIMQNLCKKNTDIDDNSNLILRMENGTIGTVEVSWTYFNGEKNTTEIYCEKGVIRIQDSFEENVVVELTDGTVEKYSLKQTTIGKRGQINSMVIDNFVDSILQQKKPAVSGEEGLRALQIILAAISSSQRKELILMNKEN
ncbi:Gfo/Idh/MocA family oxidoreductase [Paenibacillus motobuensis]|uniref:Gfo/Idh/MocA family oxidoreductase n=1 Tax=Paenibacillus motobuensis TaxID=295324 RepID=A0ABN0XXZ2_9BACL